MWKWVTLFTLAGLVAFTNAVDNFTMSVSPPPVPGKPFTITWNPDTTGDVDILLNVFDPINPTLDIILYPDLLTVVSNSGSWVWNVPSTLCGRYSFSIAADMVNRYNYGQIWSIPCPTTSATVIQTTACSSSIPSPTGANSFLLPNADNYPFRVGKAIDILWKPTTSGSVSIIGSSVSTQSITVANDIPNSGSFAWTPPFDLSSSSSIIAGNSYKLEIVDGASQMITSTSPSINILLPNYGCVFINVDDWSYPVVGNSITIQWSPSNASTISIQVTSGMVPDLSNSIYIATNMPNIGSFTWKVPSNFMPGRYTVIVSSPGRLFDDLQVIVVSTSAASPCSLLGGSAAFSSTPQVTSTTVSSLTSSIIPSSTSASTAIGSSGSSPMINPLLLVLDYTKLLQTTCATSIEPSYTSIISSGTTTLFPTVGCSNSALSATSSAQGCNSGYLTFSVASNSSVCCPSLWQTSSLDVMYCFFSPSTLQSTSVAASAAKVYTTSTSLVQSTVSTVFVISSIVFTRAETVTNGSVSSTSSLGASSSPNGSASLLQPLPSLLAYFASYMGFILLGL